MSENQDDLPEASTEQPPISNSEDVSSLAEEDLPAPPAGYIYLTGADDDFLTGADGALLLGVL